MTDAATKMPIKTDGPAVRRSLMHGRSRPAEHSQTEVDRLLSDFLRGYWHVPFRRSVVDVEPYWRGQVSFGTAPAVDIVENDDEYKLTAELPGVNEQNVEIKFSEDTLTLKGRKEEEKEDQEQDHFLSERRYGSFQRSFRVPEEVDTDQIAASLKNGVLTVTLKKTAEVQKRHKKIVVSKG